MHAIYDDTVGALGNDCTEQYFSVNTHTVSTDPSLSTWKPRPRYDVHKESTIPSKL